MRGKREDGRVVTVDRLSSGCCCFPGDQLTAFTFFLRNHVRDARFQPMLTNGPLQTVKNVRRNKEKENLSGNLNDHYA